MATPYYNDKSHLLNAIKMLAAATEALCEEELDPGMTSYWAAAALQHIIAMIPEEDRTDAETAVLAALNKYNDDPDTAVMVDDRA